MKSISELCIEFSFGYTCFAISYFSFVSRSCTSSTGVFQECDTAVEIVALGCTASSIFDKIGSVGSNMLKVTVSELAVISSTRDFLDGPHQEAVAGVRVEPFDV